MGKKQKASDARFARMVLESSTDIWLAGLAAFRRAQDEGSKLFGSLVQHGEQVEAQTLKVTEQAFDQVRDGITETWDTLEQVFEARVAWAARSLGVPTREDIRALSDRVDTLAKSLEQLADAAPITHSGPDDLKAISGIGPVIERKLLDAGITSYEQIAEWTENDIEDIERRVLGQTGRVRRDDWVAQARKLVAGATQNA